MHENSTDLDDASAMMSSVAEARFRAIFDSTFEFIGLLQPDGTLLEANHAALEFIGVPLSELLGKPFWDAPWWSYSHEVQRRLERAISDAAQGQFVRYEVEHRGRGGAVIDTDFSISPIRDRFGNVVLLVAEGRDITDRKLGPEKRQNQGGPSTAPWGKGGRVGSTARVRAMAEPPTVDLVQTRLSPPSRASGTITRDRLAGLVTDIRKRVLTVVKAPPGYGKTTLLGQWFDVFHAEGAAVGWLRLVPMQDDLSSFFRYLVGAIEVSRPGIGRRVTTLLQSARPSVAAVTTAFINSVAEAGEDIFLCIDDIHLGVSDDVIRSLEMLLAQPPGNLHLIVTTRHSLPVSLSSLRAHGGYTEIESDQLSFSGKDAAQFLGMAGLEGLSGAEIDFLVEKTEGWAAGLQLASISLAQGRDVKNFFESLSGTHRNVAEYLVDNALKSQRASTLDFLLKTSILSRLCPELCNAVTGRDDARAELDNLEKNGLFLFPQDPERNWYRYHAQFASFLQSRLAEQDPSLAPLLHRRASAWFAEHDLLDEAFTHAAEAGDVSRAGELLDQAAERLPYAPASRTLFLLEWIKQLPSDVLQRLIRPRLELASSIASVWRFEEASTIVREVEEELASQPQPVGYGAGLNLRHVLAHRKMMLHYFMDDVARTQHSVLNLLKDFPDDDPLLRGVLETIAGYVAREHYALPGWDRIDARARQCYERSGDSTFPLVWHESIMAPGYFLAGDTERAEQALIDARAAAEQVHGKSSPLAAMPALLLAEVLYEKNECDKASEILDDCESEADKQGCVDHLMAYYRTKIRLSLRKDGTQGEARDILRSGRALAERHGFARLERCLEAEELRLSLANNELDDVKRFQKRLSGPVLEAALNPGPNTTTIDEIVAIAWCRACCALGEQSEAIRVLKRWIAFTQKRGAVRSEVRLLILLSAALARGQKEVEASRFLRDAVKKAARPRLVRSFIDEGKVIEFLLLRLFKDADNVSDPTTAFGLELLQIFEQERAGSERLTPTAAPEPGASIMPEQLNARETEVIRLVSVGMSNREIGERLGLSEATVKWHLQGVFNKLHVRRRREAVLQARKFGIV